MKKLTTSADRLLSIAVLAVILLSFVLQALFALPRLSSTTDEPVHIAAGYSYWQTRDFRLNPEHPPLAKLIAAMPLLVIRPKLDTSHPAWAAASEYDFGVNFLYGNDADRILFWSRAPIVALAAAGLLITFLWARDLFGTSAGLFAAAMYAFCPNLLAHGTLVTTDVPLGVFVELALYLFWKRAATSSWKIDALVGLALGGAMATKFSGAFLPVLLIIFCFVRERRSALKSLIIMGAAALFVIEAAYFFSASPLLYFKNATLVNANHVRNYPFYLFGALKPGGWWYYFLAAFLVKATIPALLVLFLGALHTTAGFVQPWGEFILLTSIALYTIIISVGADQIGVRYLLPIVPLIFVWGSRIIPRAAATRGGFAIVTVLLAWQVLSSIRAFPNYIPFFNEAAGGAAHGPALLDDSNVDWGQGVKQAAEYVRQHHLENVTMYTFSPFDNPEYYGLPRNVPPSQAFERFALNRPRPGIYIISAHYVARLKVVSAAWQSYRPIDRIGESLWVFSF